MLKIVDKNNNIMFEGNKIGLLNEIASHFSSKTIGIRTSLKELSYIIVSKYKLFNGTKQIRSNLYHYK